MHTLILLFSCLGFFMLYNTSQKAKLSAGGPFERWLQRTPKSARVVGVLLILLGTAAFVYRDGWTAGLFAALLLLMVAAAYTVAIAPLYYLKLKHMVALVLGSLFFELFIF